MQKKTVFKGKIPPPTTATTIPWCSAIHLIKAPALIYPLTGNRPTFCLSNLFIYTLPVRRQDFSAWLRLQVFRVGGVQRATWHLLKLFMTTNIKRNKSLLQLAAMKCSFFWCAIWILWQVCIRLLFISASFNATTCFIYLFIYLWCIHTTNHFEYITCITCCCEFYSLMLWSHFLFSGTHPAL